MNRTGIITLLTDFGLSDPYAAMMKGVILSINPDAYLVDITHGIRTGAIIQGAFVMLETYSYFPKGTVHLAVVDPGVGSERRHIGVEADGHLFVGPDNGVLCPLIERNKDSKVIHLTDKKIFRPHITNTFHGREVFAPVAAHLSKGDDLAAMGNIIDDPQKLDVPVPYVRNEALFGQVMRVDNFGNLITNIRRDVLEKFLDSFEPVISIGDLKIKKLGKIYSDTDKGDLLALINSSDTLEIAVNLGRASEYLKVDLNEIIGTVVKVGKYQ